jgi:HEAT repeat protein
MRIRAEVHRNRLRGTGSSGSILIADEVHRFLCRIYSGSRQEDFAMPSGSNGPTIEPLIENLQDAEQVVRIHAATVIGSMGEDAEPAVPALIEMLQSDDVQDRRLAALTLGEIGPAAEEAIPALFAAVDDEDGGVAEMAETALAQIDVADDQAEAA